MNDELAEKLKDAGLNWDDDYPSLEELIEACGDGFDSLRYSFVNGREDKIWVAFHNKVYAIQSSPLNALHMGGKEGSTPSEAVANLWISLNQKKSL